MRKAEGIILTPSGAIIGGPSWTPAISDIRPKIDQALAGRGVVGKTHLVILTGTAHTVLLAWDSAARRSRGAWLVGQGNGGGGYSVSAPDIGLNATPGLRWYGSWINGNLWLGNGVDPNLCYAGGTLRALGSGVPSSDTDHPAKVHFPPCIQWVTTADKVIYGAGNATDPLKVWATERATALYPNLEGIYSLETSCTSIAHTRATRITALQVDITAVRVHTDAGVITLSGFEDGADANKTQQTPTQAPSAALSPNCASDSEGTIAYYFAADHEIYRESGATQGGYGQKRSRDLPIATSSGAGLWSAAMSSAPADAGDYQLIYDRDNALLFVLAPLANGTRAIYAYHEPDDGPGAITGPIRLTDAADLILQRNGARSHLVAITRQGSILTADLSELRERDTWEISAYSAPLPEERKPAASAPAVIPGLPKVSVDDTANAYAHDIDGRILVMDTPWSEWQPAPLPSPRLHFANATVAILELSNEDMGSPDLVKEFLQVRLQWQRNTPVYVGIYAESEGRRYGRWHGTRYPREEQLAGLKLAGRRITLRLIVVYFNDLNFLLRSLSIDWLPASED